MNKVEKLSSNAKILQFEKENFVLLQPFSKIDYVYD
jgi:hypothetical protein